MYCRKHFQIENFVQNINLFELQKLFYVATLTVKILK